MLICWHRISARDVNLSANRAALASATQVGRQPVCALIARARSHSIFDIGESRYPMLPISCCCEPLRDIKVSASCFFCLADRKTVTRTGLALRIGSWCSTPRFTTAPSYLVTIPGAAHGNHSHCSFEAIQLLCARLERAGVAPPRRERIASVPQFVKPQLPIEFSLFSGPRATADHSAIRTLAIRGAAH